MFKKRKSKKSKEDALETIAQENPIKCPINVRQLEKLYVTKTMYNICPVKWLYRLLLLSPEMN